MRLTMKVTERCMGRCPGCTARLAWSQARRTEAPVGWDMDMGFAKDVLRQASLIGFDWLVLSGGEPTVYPYLSELIQFAREQGFPVKVNTNGWDTTSLLQELRDGKLTGLSLSLYSLDPDEYYALRGNKEMYRRAMHAVRSFGAHATSSTNTCSMVLQTIITNRNFRELPDILQLAFELGFSILSTSYIEDAYRHPELRLSTSDIELFRSKIVPQLRRLLDSYPLSRSDRERNLRTLASYFDPQINSYENWALGIYRPNGEPRCDQPGNFLLVYADGLAAPCCGFEYWQAPEFMEMLPGRGVMSVLRGTKFIRFSKERMEFCRYCPAGMNAWLYLPSARGVSS